MYSVCLQANVIITLTFNRLKKPLWTPSCGCPLGRYVPGTKNYWKTKKHYKNNLRVPLYLKHWIYDKLWVRCKENNAKMSKCMEKIVSGELICIWRAETEEESDWHDAIKWILESGHVEGRNNSEVCMRWYQDRAVWHPSAYRCP